MKRNIAWPIFIGGLGFLLLYLAGMMAAAAIIRTRSGELTTAQAEGLLSWLYWGTYPLLFVILVALAWHMVRFFRGADAV